MRIAKSIVLLSCLCLATMPCTTNADDQPLAKNTAEQQMQQLHATLKKANDTLEKLIKSFEDKIEYRHPMLLSLPGFKALYSVLENGELVLVEGTSLPQHALLWKSVAQVYGDARSALTSFAVFDTDAKLAGATVWTNAKQRKFGLAINGHWATTTASIQAIAIHELGHTYGRSRGWGAFIKENGCPERIFNQGYVDPVVSEFYTRFWQHCSDKDSPRATRTWKNFVTPYAAVRVEEDVAESYTAFVLCDMPSAQKKDMRAEKLQVFWHDPAFVKIRSDLRARIGEKTIRQIKGEFGYYCRPNIADWE